MKTYELRFRQFKRGRRSERTMKIPAKTQSRAERLFLRGVPGSQEVREMQRLNRRVDLVGQAITALAIALGALVLVYSIVRWLCGF